jgi:hypothetical protein
LFIIHSTSSFLVPCSLFILQINFIIPSSFFNQLQHSLFLVHYSLSNQLKHSLFIIHSTSSFLVPCSLFKSTSSRRPETESYLHSRDTSESIVCKCIKINQLVSKNLLLLVLIRY